MALLLFTFHANCENLKKIKSDFKLLIDTEMAMGQKEEKANAFFVGRAYALLTAQAEDGFGAQLQMGRYYLNTPEYFKYSNSRELIQQANVFIIKERHIQRAGLQALPLVYESLENDSEYILDRSLIFQEQYLALFDFGYSYSYLGDTFKYTVLLHNGEGRFVTEDVDANDDRYFLSQRLGLDMGNNHLGLFVQLGQYMPNGSFSAEPDKIKYAALNYKYKSNKLRSSVVVGGATYESTTASTKFNHATVDLGYSLSSIWDLDFRLDYFDPNKESNNDSISEFTAALSKNYEAGKFSLLLIQNRKEEGQKNGIVSLKWVLQNF